MGIFAGGDLEQERIMTAAVGWHDRRDASEGGSLVAARPPPRRQRSWRRSGQGLRSSPCSRCSRSSLFNLVVDDYLSARFVSRLLIAISITAAGRRGESLVIITRNIDLSIGSIVGVSAYLTAELLADRGLPAGHRGHVRGRRSVLLGLVNGVLVAVAKVPSIIVTLGTLSIYRSVLTNHAGGQTIATGDLPSWIVDLPRSTLFTSASTRCGRCSSWPFVIVAIALHLVLQYTRAAVTSTPSARTRRRPARPASRSGAPDRGLRRVRGRWRGSPGSSTSAASARST